jgi:hypothetical protein
LNIIVLRYQVWLLPLLLAKGVGIDRDFSILRAAGIETVRVPPNDAEYEGA